MSHSHSSHQRRFSRIAWIALAFNLAVIVWGALVRATGSGAGCGAHWPLCNGEVIPDEMISKTAIEFTHRIMSGGSLIFAAVTAWMGMKHFNQGSLVRKGALAVLGFTLVEALIGAGLVLLRYVEHDQSVGRVVSICLHLTNTFLLLAAQALTAAWSTPRFASLLLREGPSAPSRKVRWLSWGSLATTTLLGITGAIAALGDTLFKSTSLAHGIAQDFAPASHFLLKLRVIHPFLAVGAAALLFYFAEVVSERAPAGALVRKLSTALKGLVAFQLALGAVNLLLLAPTGLQLAHLLVAECLWVALVLTTALGLKGAEAHEASSAAAAARLARAEPATAESGSSC
jgi:cytochrome c oxidase assembly protein subunit 15